MGVTRTGNAEIDQQHAILDGMVAELELVCHRSGDSASAICTDCQPEQQRSCNARLNVLATELRAFLVGHCTYEEKMMQLLPRTQHCLDHIKRHTDAHTGVARQLKKVSLQISREHPVYVRNRLIRIVRHWLGDHTALFDTDLASQLAEGGPSEFDCDEELVTILDEYVFHDRPTKSRSSRGEEMNSQRKKLEIRGRFESLSPAQREVFWKVVCGYKNKEIASDIGISINTVKTHRAAIFQKMDVSSVLDLLKKTDVLRRAFPEDS